MSQLSWAVGIPGAHSRGGGGGGVLRQRHEGSMSQLSRAIGIPGAHSREGGGGYSDRDMRGVHVTAEPGHRHPGRPLPGGGGGT